MLEFSNELNSLCMEGSLVYTDVEGYVTGFLGKTNIAVVVDLKQILVTEDGIAAIKTVDEANTLYHKFLVNNIELLDRDGGTLTYKLYLTSVNFNALVKTVHYSNYGKEPEHVTDILKSLMARAAEGFNADNMLSGDSSSMFKLDKSFEDDDFKSQVAMHYVTNGNDNMLTISKFLLSRMFYF